VAPWPPAAAARVERVELCQVDEPVAVRVQLMEGLRDRGSERHGCVTGRHGAYARFSFPISMVFSSFSMVLVLKSPEKKGLVWQRAKILALEENLSRMKG